MSWLFRVFDDEFTVGFCRVDEDSVSAEGSHRRLRFDRDCSPPDSSYRCFIIAAAVLLEGERLQRAITRRKLKKGTRNIRNRTGHAVRFLGLALEPKLMATGDRKEKRRRLRG